MADLAPDIAETTVIDAWVAIWDEQTSAHSSRDLETSGWF